MKRVLRPCPPKNQKPKRRAKDIGWTFLAHLFFSGAWGPYSSWRGSLCLEFLWAWGFSLRESRPCPNYGSQSASCRVLLAIEKRPIWIPSKGWIITRNLSSMINCLLKKMNWPKKIRQAPKRQGGRQIWPSGLKQINLLPNKLKLRKKINQTSIMEEGRQTPLERSSLWILAGPTPCR